MNGPGRIRTTLDSASRTPISQNPAENSTQDGTPKGDFDPDLGFIVSHWHDLKLDVRRSIMHTVRASIHPPDADRRRADDRTYLGE
jgi:hypothetical protein